MWQISYPPANGASLGSYLSKNGFLGQKRAKWGQSKQLWHSNLQTFFDEVMIFELVGDVVETKIFFSPFYFASPEINEVEIRHRQTDKFFDTKYGFVWIFSSI